MPANYVDIKRLADMFPEPATWRLANMGSKFGPSYMAVCEITFKTWADTLSEHGKVCMDMIGHQLKSTVF